MNLIPQGYDFLGPFLQSLGIQGVTAFVPLSILRDGTSYAATNKTTTGSSIQLPANTMLAGRSLRFKVWGTIAGVNAAKTVQLAIGATVLASIAFTAAAAGNFYAEFTLLEVTDIKHQRLGAFGVCGTKAGATTDLGSDNETATIDFSLVQTLITQVISANAGDTVTQTMCTIELLS